MSNKDNEEERKRREAQEEEEKRRRDADDLFNQTMSIIMTSSMLSSL